MGLSRMDSLTCRQCAKQGRRVDMIELGLRKGFTYSSGLLCLKSVRI